MRKFFRELFAAVVEDIRFVFFSGEIDEYYNDDFEDETDIRPAATFKERSSYNSGETVPELNTMAG